MSYNATTRFSKSRLNNAAAEAAGDGFDLKNLSACRKQAWSALAAERRPSELYRYYVSSAGLGELLQRGCDDFIEELGVEGAGLPHNLIWSEMSGRLMPGPTEFGYGGRWIPGDDAAKLIEWYARAGGWMRAAAKLPAVRQVILKTQSPRGVNSPYTTIDLWWMVRRFQSPGRFERKLWAVKRRAEAMLSAWSGSYHPAWRDIANAVMKTDSVGKAATIVTACTLDDESLWGSTFSYREARDWLTGIRSAAFPVANTSDGVEGRRHAEPTLVKQGFAVYRIRYSRKYGKFSLGWLAMAPNGRTFHADYYGTAKDALKVALRNWKRQDELAKENADLVGYLNGDETGWCPLIVREDSYEAGNCSAGTESFLRRMGWEDRDWIPGPWLIESLGDSQVLRVLHANRRRHI